MRIYFKKNKKIILSINNRNNNNYYKRVKYIFIKVKSSQK